MAKKQQSLYQNKNVGHFIALCFYMAVAYSLYIAASNMNYVWKWNSIPDYFIYNEIKTIEAPVDGKLVFEDNTYFIDNNGEKKVPVVLHRAIFGTFDRFTAFILEETKGALPLWLSPVQINIIPVNNEYHLEYATNLLNKLRDKEFRVELDSRDEKMGYKIREAQTKKIPYTLVLGNNERDNNTITYRKYGEESTTTMSTEEFITMIEEQIKEYK